MSLITQIAADIAARVPAMAQDNPINNATLIEGLLRPIDQRAEVAKLNELLDKAYCRLEHSTHCKASWCGGSNGCNCGMDEIRRAILNLNP